MTDKERKRRRQQIERRMQARKNGGKVEEENTRAIFLLRTYITVILAGSIFVASLVGTETTKRMCMAVETNLANHLQKEDITAARAWIAQIMNGKEISLPTFQEEQKENQKEEVLYQPELEDSP